MVGGLDRGTYLGRVGYVVRSRESGEDVGRGGYPGFDGGVVGLMKRVRYRCGGGPGRQWGGGAKRNWRGDEGG